MQMSGRLSYIEKEQYDNMKASGTIGLTNMKLKMQDMPDVDIKKSLFTFTPKYLQLSETTDRGLYRYRRVYCRVYH